MPYARKTKKTRRPARKYRRRSRKLLSFTKAPVPNKFATKLRYVSDQNLTINPGVGGTAGVHVVAANGLYDPDITATGHQPRGFDQFMTMYDHYTVVGSKITVWFGQPNGYSHEDTMCCVALKDSATPLADINGYLEGRNISSRALSGSYNGQHNAGVLTITKTASTRKYLGRSHPMSDPDLKGSVTANPAEMSYFHIAAAPFGSGDASQTNIWYRVDYLVVFTEPKQPSQS